MAFAPSSEAQKILASGEPLGRMLERETGLKVKVSVPVSYAAVIDAMGADTIDVAWLAPTAYVRAKDKVGAEVILAAVRGGSTTSTGRVIVRADSGIVDVGQLKGKRFAFASPTSASGFLYPNALLLARGIDYKTYFSETTFVGGHDKVVLAVYNGQVDGAATFGDDVGGLAADTQALQEGALTGAMAKVVAIARTEPIPNDTVRVRRGLPAEIVTRLRDGLLRVAESAEGGRALKDLDRVDGLAPSVDRDYEPIRKAAEALNPEPE